jgi:hypothetical protein
MTNPQAGGPVLIGCPPLLIRYIRGYPPKVGAVSSNCILRTLHAMVTRDPLIMGSFYLNSLKNSFSIKELSERKCISSHELS